MGGKMKQSKKKFVRQQYIGIAFMMDADVICGA